MKTMTVTELKARCKAAGCHFFSRDTVRFFGTKMHGRVTVEGDVAYFSTTEQQPYGPRIIVRRSVTLGPDHIHTTIHNPLDAV
jgi:hypothetical protein